MLLGQICEFVETSPGSFAQTAQDHVTIFIKSVQTAEKMIFRRFRAYLVLYRSLFEVHAHLCCGLTKQQDPGGPRDGRTKPKKSSQCRSKVRLGPALTVSEWVESISRRAESSRRVVPRQTVYVTPRFQGLGNNSKATNDRATLETGNGKAFFTIMAFNARPKPRLDPSTALRF